MQIVLPGALPDAAIAQALIPHMEEKAPRFTGWLGNARAELIPAAPADTFCTPYEFWMLGHHGYRAEAGKPAAAGLAALHARAAGTEADPAQPLWLAQLVHVAPAREGAALVPGTELEITPDESVALFESAAEFLEGTGFSAWQFDTQHWRIEPPAGYEPLTPSPTLVSITSVNDWWTQDIAGRPWRRLVNELQMLWFDHPVNRAREARGLRPVNSLWLYGGAAPSALTPDAQMPKEPVRIFRDLLGPALVQDWGSWLQALEHLEQQEFSQFNAMPKLVLTGSDRIAELNAARQGLLTKLFKGKQDWRRWWSAHN